MNSDEGIIYMVRSTLLLIIQFSLGRIKVRADKVPAVESNFFDLYSFSSWCRKSATWYSRKTPLRIPLSYQRG